MTKRKLLPGLTLLILCLNHTTFGQALLEDELIGTWMVIKFESQVNVSEMPSDEKVMMSRMEKAFLDSKFIFQPDKKMVFDFVFEEAAVKNGYWKYDSNLSRVTIQEWEDRQKSGSDIMRLQVVTKGEKIFFIVEETPFILEVRKI